MSQSNDMKGKKRSKKSSRETQPEKKGPLMELDSDIYDPSKMSSGDLIANLNTLNGGLSLFRQLVGNESNEILSVYDSQSQGTISISDSQGSMSVSDSQGTVSVCHSQEEVRTRGRTCSSENNGIIQYRSNRSRVASSDSNVSVKSTGSTLSEKGVKLRKFKKTKTGDIEVVKDNPMPMALVLIEERNEKIQADQEDKKSLMLRQGEAQFDELMKRFDSKPALQKVCGSSTSILIQHTEDEDFDLKKTGQLMRSVFCDYDEKQRQYEFHSMKVKDIGQAQLKHHFSLVKADIANIFEGRLKNSRMQLYLSKEKNDRSRLEKILVADPFTNMQSMTVASELIDFLVPDTDRMMYNEFIKLVMLPEGLIRIYSSINDISYDQAEKEMKWGPRYDGPIDKKEVTFTEKRVLQPLPTNQKK